MTFTDMERFLTVLCASDKLQSLWSVGDRGMPVFAHTVDVTLLCLDAYPDWNERHGGLDLGVIVLGALLHDLSKVSSRLGGLRSHSHIMSHEPALAVAEAMDAVEETSAATGIRLGSERIDHLWHVIAAHHGRWGLVHPQTMEALLVHECDHFSSTHHRLAPVDANDILPLLQQGYSWTQVGMRLGVGRAIVKRRLQDACRAERVLDWVSLVPLFQRFGTVLAGTPAQIRQLERAGFIMEEAQQAPGSLIERIRPLMDGPTADVYLFRPRNVDAELPEEAG